MADHYLPQIRLIHHKDFTIHVSSEERDGVWYPRYQIFHDGVPRTDLRIALMRPCMSVDFAMDIASDLAKEDVKLGLFDYGLDVDKPSD